LVTVVGTIGKMSRNQYLSLAKDSGIA